MSKAKKEYYDNRMNIQLIDRNSALPTVLRGMRKLNNTGSIRELGRISGVSPAVISRLERGLAMPSVDLLWRWASGLNDGRPNPELWMTTIYASAATWPRETQFLWVRYANPGHDPELCWSLACATSDLVSTAMKVTSDCDYVTAYMAAGAHRFPRFTSLVESGNADAHCAAWFEMVRRAAPAMVNKLSHDLFASGNLVPTADDDEHRKKLSHLMEIYVANGQELLRESNLTDEFPTDLMEHWSQLTLTQQDIIRQLIASWIPEQ